MNPKEKGEITEYIIIAQLLKDGFSVSKPCGDSQRYDLLVDVESKILKIQTPSLGQISCSLSIPDRLDQAD